jgi:puromycin-sensitive aminopeptidase
VTQAAARDSSARDPSARDSSARDSSARRPAGLDPYRLPRHTVPSRYDLVLEPDLAAATFRGTVTIDVTCSEHTDLLVLNAIELEIDHVAVDGLAATVSLEAATERMFVTPDGSMAPGDHTLTVEFRGVHNDKLRGWYRSVYSDADGNEHVLVASQMQSTDGRRVFPCWDEPDFKAVFAVTLVVDPELTAVSNCREVDRTRTGSGKVAVRFADTMVMSSYLVALVVGRLEATEWVDVAGIPTRVVHVPGKGHLTGFGVECAAFCLAWFQEYYGIDYPGDKVELVALPDFAAGAMENLGCITFRENLLLVDPALATQSERQVVADVIAHELAHMWFGDLVTMSWWNGIWLNEAFATFMELLACDAFRPDWERWTAFGLERSVAFETDSLSSTRSVEFPVHSPSDCEGMFDVLTYQKGGALLRMLEQYLGDDVFRAGVGHYLRTHAYANTETGDLWDAIEHVSGEPVRRMMDSWIWQPGYPLISVDVAGDQLVVTQCRFAFDPDDASAAVWSVPIGIRQGIGPDATTTSVLLDGDELRVAATGGPVVVNAGGHGFFRVAYSDELRARLTGDAVTEMTTLERYNLVDDAWNAVVAGALDATEFVALVERFGDERELSVWQSVMTGLRAVSRLIGDDEPARTGFRRRVVALARPALDSLGEPATGEPELTARLRGLLLTAVAVVGGDDDARRRARTIYDAWCDDPSGVDAELAAAATGVVAAIGDRDDYDAMLARAMQGGTPQDQLRHLYVLADFDDADLMARTCELALSDRVRTQNAPFLLRLAIGNRRHGRQAWRFVREHWSEIDARMPRNMMVRMVDTVRQLDLPADVVDVAAFFAEHPIPQGAKTLEQVLERQRVNADVRARNEAPLRAAFA